MKKETQPEKQDLVKWPKNKKELFKLIAEAEAAGFKNERKVHFASITFDNLVDAPGSVPYEEEGGIKYYVVHQPTHTYTAIGARNIHHAYNKATKLYGGKWTSMGKEVPDFRWEYLPVADFGALIAEYKHPWQRGEPTKD